MGFNSGFKGLTGSSNILYLTNKGVSLVTASFVWVRSTCRTNSRGCHNAEIQTVLLSVVTPCDRVRGYRRQKNLLPLLGQMHYVPLMLVPFSQYSHSCMHAQPTLEQLYPPTLPLSFLQCLCNHCCRLPANANQKFACWREWRLWFRFCYTLIVFRVSVNYRASSNFLLK